MGYVGVNKDRKRQNGVSLLLTIVFSYDRLLHNPVEDAINIDGDIIILEGNYLLLDEEGWRDVADFAD